jgi:AcrR family transcriptional regulator
MPRHVPKAKQNTARLRWGAGARIDNREYGAARIIGAARNCIARSSVTSTTIVDIAEQAGVSRRTVYRYFDSKEAIILAVVEDQARPFFEEMRRSMAAKANQPFLTQLKHCVLFAIEKGPQMEGHQLLLGKKNASATADFYLGSSTMRSQMRDLLERPFEQALATGEIDREWQLDLLLNWLGRLIYSFVLHREPIANIERQVNLFLFPDMRAKAPQLTGE